MSLPMAFGLEGARVLITAGASGIGLATARAFTQQGARVHVCDVDSAALDALGTTDATIGRSICDVADRASVSRLFDDVIRAFGGLDALVNNAGIAGPTARCEDLDEGVIAERTLAVNITGQFHCARLAIRTCGKAITRASPIFVGRRSFRLSLAHALCRVEGGRHRLYQVAVDGAWRRRHSRQRDLSGIGRGRED
jgi:NAD(P)-dependent dehydrogenase (short-subunit alcohol dehydrogenase family)